tara:strand:+ start:4117 stop:4584 length:468 start_codon:yes stop_codon:yes gene_type:complete
MKQKLRYEPLTGKFFWLVNNAQVSIGQEVKGSIRESGHIKISVGSQLHLAHRLAYELMGEEVPEFIDHVDQDPANNKWKNLRPCTFQQNQWNTAMRSTNTSGFKNVYFRKARNKWIAKVPSLDGLKHVGTFDSAYEANIAAIAARAKHQGDFAHV